MERLAHEHKPKMIVAGASSYARVIDWKRFRKIADAVGAYLFVDMAHYAGLVAAGFYPNPVGIADFVTSTTHKTLRGPRGGIIMAKPEHEKALNSAIFPQTQGGPLMHVIAAKAVAFKEAATKEFKDYQEQVIENARVMAKVLQQRGLRIVSGQTDCHMFGRFARNESDGARKNRLSWRILQLTRTLFPRSAETICYQRYSCRSPAITTRGFKELKRNNWPIWIADVLATFDSALSCGY